jgi:hypothetical protein
LTQNIEVRAAGRTQAEGLQLLEACGGDVEAAERFLAQCSG